MKRVILLGTVCDSSFTFEVRRLVDGGLLNGVQVAIAMKDQLALEQSLSGSTTTTSQLYPDDETTAARPTNILHRTVAFVSFSALNSAQVTNTR